MTLTAWLTDYNSKNSLGSRFRRARSAALRTLIDAAYARNGLVRIVDIGGTQNYWNVFDPAYLRERGVQITLLNRERDTVTAPFVSIVGDARSLPYADGEFDIAHSNSVIEHVGTWTDMVSFANELQRVGSAYFVQTPYYWCPIEPHFMTPFFHWMPRPVRLRLVRAFALGQFPKAADVQQAAVIVDSARLLDRKMFSALFPGATVQMEWIGLIPKSMIAIRAGARSA